MDDDPRELARIRRLVHALVCRDRLSPQLARERLTAYQIERTTVEIESDLRAYACESCASWAELVQQPEAEPLQPVSHPAVQAGWLTGMIGRG